MTTQISPEELRFEAAEGTPVGIDGHGSRPGELLAHRAASFFPEERQAVWGSLPEVDIPAKTAREARLVTMDRWHVAHSAFDILRTNVLQVIRRNGWKSIGITSPTSVCGKTLVSMNLAFAFQHQEDCRTVLLDLDLKRPQIANSLKLADVAPIADFLKGDIDLKRVFRRHGMNLAIGANSTAVEYSAELLQSPETAKALARMCQRLGPDVVLYDLPPMLVSDDVLAFLPNVDSVLLIAGAENSTIDEVDICEQQLAEKTNVLGVVLNGCRYPSEKYGY